MSFAERGDLLGEAVAGLARAAARSTRSSVVARRVEAAARSPRRSELRRQRHRRQPRAVQDLVGVGVADAAEQVRIGQRALERVVLARRARARNAPRSASSTSSPPRIERGRAPPRRARTCSDARRFVPGLGEESACRSGSRTRASPILPRSFGAGAPASAAGRRSSGGSRGRARPRARSTIRLPSRRSAAHAPPATSRAADRRCAAGTGWPGARARAAAPDARARAPRGRRRRRAARACGSQCRDRAAGRASVPPVVRFGACRRPSRRPRWPSACPRPTSSTATSASTTTSGCGTARILIGSVARVNDCEIIAPRIRKTRNSSLAKREDKRAWVCLTFRSSLNTGPRFLFSDDVQHTAFGKKRTWFLRRP